ncbi:MAG: hypothetical protein GW808_10745 [Sphingomonadales bacterium]|nr:hypothetical protein [Sphingomonadales bacterium]PIX67635.1 MAG: hypothetical protein COZ43_00430 [Sphingomonadales bacterium CG_4_10_14_3_um_filter_58_15]NCO49701.1 hypothetical protein [Sphingomonadales bacterium]NCP01018.1 hypothetical protein [Sphingomonadales bacterium]NCP25611.1 hypothetical protein [Sphingomonadales bacterium]
MSKLTRSLMLSGAAFALPLTLAACGSKDASDEELAQLDDNLTSDPAMNDALEDSILVDPDLTDQANRNTIRSANGAADGSVPPGTGEDGSAAAKAVLGGKILAAPKPRQMTSDDETMTLGDKAELQEARQNKPVCKEKLTYDMAWANKLPPEFAVYPKANVQEAAGKCDLRVVSFTTATPIKSVVDYYYTQAKRGGYDAEYLLRGTEHVLGGSKANDTDAYVITLNKRSGGGTVVDIVASNTR